MKLFLLITFYTAILFAQNTDTIFADTQNFLSTGKQLVLSPLSFNSTDILHLSGAVIAVSGAFLLDHEFKQMAIKNRSDFNRYLVNIDRYYYVPTAATLAGGIYLYGFIFENKEMRHLGLDLGEAAFYASIANIGLKFISGRSRPLRTDDNSEFHPFQRAPVHSAFASAHTTLAFAISTVMSAQSDNILWKAGWYTAAGLVGAARIYRRMHWFSDVILGGTLGYFIGSYVTDKNNNLEITFTPGGGGIKINF